MRKNLEESERGPLLEGNSGERTINDDGTHIDPVGSSEGQDNDLLADGKAGDKGDAQMGEASVDEEEESDVESSLAEEDA